MQLGLPFDHDSVCVAPPAPTSALSRRQRYALKAQAQHELPARLLELAGQHGLAVARITIGNQKSRWGSCGRNGHISLNWRLVRMPAWVRDYVLIHELMHLRELNHSASYWTLVAAACPDYKRARRWLRTEGRSL